MFENMIFPSMPSFIAEWRAVYFEPIPNSKERIVILIIAKEKDNHIIVFDALHPTVVDSLYGSKASSFHGMINLIKKDILKNQGESSIQGVYPGKWHLSQSSDLKGIIKQALYKTASLGAVALKGLYDSDQETFENEQLDRRWSNRIKDEVLRINPSYERAFDLKIPVGKDVKISCGFHTAFYSAKFNVCTAQTIVRMKSNLFDLQILDTHKISNHFDLILHMPMDNDLQISSKRLARMKANVSILQDEISLKSNIKIFTCHTEQEGASRILEMLKAG